MIIKLFKCFIRPLLEYASVVYSPHHIGLINVIENVQHRFTKRLYGMNGIDYSRRLELCNLELLELRRLHADIIMMYKILNGVICVNLENYISLSAMHHTRGNTFKLYKYRAKLDIRKFFFSMRIINLWNSLPNNIVCCTSVKSFVKRLKSFNLSHFLKGHACY